MPTRTWGIFFCLLCAPLAAQALTPEQSFRAFLDAVTRPDVEAAARRAAIERYFDFDSWLRRHGEAQGREIPADEAAQRRAEWFDVLEHEEFRARFVGRELTVLETLTEERIGGEAELLVRLSGPGGAFAHFRVHMTPAPDGSFWRWYEMPAAQAPVQEEQTLEQSIARLEESLWELRRQRELLDLQEQALEGELRRLRATLHEQVPGESPFGTPRRAAQAVGAALRGGDMDALLAAHHPEARRALRRETLAGRAARARESLARWEVLDSWSVGDDESLVRVRLTLWGADKPVVRTQRLRLKRHEETWLLIEAP
jgi:hypothetical protein